MLISISDSVSLEVSGTEAVVVAAEGLCGDLNVEDLETPFLLKTETVLQSGLLFYVLLSCLS